MASYRTGSYWQRLRMRYGAHFDRRPQIYLSADDLAAYRAAHDAQREARPTARHLAEMLLDLLSEGQAA